MFVLKIDGMFFQRLVANLLFKFGFNTVDLGQIFNPLRIWLAYKIENQLIKNQKLPAIFEEITI